MFVFADNVVNEKLRVYDVSGQLPLDLCCRCGYLFEIDKMYVAMDGLICNECSGL